MRNITCLDMMMTPGRTRGPHEARSEAVLRTIDRVVAPSERAHRSSNALDLGPIARPRAVLDAVLERGRAPRVARTHPLRFAPRSDPRLSQRRARARGTER